MSTEKLYYHEGDIEKFDTLELDTSKHVYFTLSAKKFIAMVEQAEALHINSFNLHYGTHNIGHSLFKSANQHWDEAGDLEMGTYGEEGEIDNYWCSRAIIMVEKYNFEGIAKRAEHYIESNQRILCKVDGFEISAQLVCHNGSEELGEMFIPFGQIMKRERMVINAGGVKGRDYEEVINFWR